jgi:chemotaxis signal transduction protein
MKPQVNGQGMESPDEKVTAVWQQRAARLSKRPMPAEAGQHAVLVLVVTLGKERYGLALEDVAEVLPPVQITTVPGAMPIFAGVIHVHGEIRGVLDLTKVMGLQAEATTGPARVVLLRRQGREIGLKVDRTEEVRRVASEQLQLTDEASTGHYIKGLTKDSLMLLNTEALFAELEKEAKS